MWTVSGWVVGVVQDRPALLGVDELWGVFCGELQARVVWCVWWCRVVVMDGLEARVAECSGGVAGCVWMVEVECGQGAMRCGAVRDGPGR